MTAVARTCSQLQSIWCVDREGIRGVGLGESEGGIFILLGVFLRLLFAGRAKLRAVVGAVARRALPKSSLERAAVPVAVAVAVVVAGCFRLATPVLVVGRRLS
jgi:hypothetical protein